MPDRRDDPWASPALDDLRDQLAAVAERDARTAPSRTPRRAAWRLGLVAAAALVGIVVVVALVSTGGERGTARAGVREAADAARRAGTFRFVTRRSLEHPGQPVQRSTIRGAVDFTADAYTTRLGDRGFGVPEVVLGRTLYVQRRDGTWGSIELARTFLDSGGGGIGGAALANPPALFALLGRTHTGVERVGRETVRGIPTTHYRFSRGLPEIAELFGVRPADAGRLRRLSATFDLWLDDRSRPVRERHVLTVRGRAARSTSTTDFSGYGEPVSIHAPAHATFYGREPADALSAGAGLIIALDPKTGLRFSPSPAVPGRGG